MIALTISTQKSVYDPKSKGDGLRVLVMRFWPRGIRKEKIDVWYRELGTTKELIKAWKAGKVARPEFRKRYLASLEDEGKRAIIRDLAKRSKKHKITLLCSCPDPSTCHRSILKEQIQKAR